MGESQAPATRLLGPRLGRLHAYRDRGAIYVDGVRTSLQAAFIGAGVAKGAEFLTLGPAVWLGLGIFVGLEVAKVLLGALDYRYKVMAAHQQLVAEHNPIVMRQLGAMEAIAANRPVNVMELRS